MVSEQQSWGFMYRSRLLPLPTQPHILSFQLGCLSSGIQDFLDWLEQPLGYSKRESSRCWALEGRDQVLSGCMRLGKSCPISDGASNLSSANIISKGCCEAKGDDVWKGFNLAWRILRVSWR